VLKPPEPGRLMWFAVVAAAVWAIGLVVAAFRLPVYGSAIYSSSATPTSISPETVLRTSQTLVEVNGFIAAVEMAVPLVATLVVAAALRAGVHRVTLALAWTSTGLLAVFNLVGMLTVGVLMLPVTGALVLACVMASRTAHAAEA